MELVKPPKLYLLLNGDTVHEGVSHEEIVSSMREAMFTVPMDNQTYMEGVRERAEMVGLVPVLVNSLKAFLASLVDLGLAEWVTEQFVKDRFGRVEKKKTGLEWIRPLISSRRSV